MGNVKMVKVKPPPLGVLGVAVEILKHWYLNRNGGHMFSDFSASFNLHLKNRVNLGMILFVLY